MLPIRIETEHLKLRNLECQDVTQDYADWLNDPEVNRYLGCAGSFQTVESCREYVSSFASRDDLALVGIFNAGGTHIGNITLAPPIQFGSGMGNVGISIGRRDASGKGLAAEALKAITGYSHKELELRRMYAYIDTGNIRCVNLFSRAGYRIEACFTHTELKSGAIAGKYPYASEFYSDYARKPSLFDGDCRSWYVVVNTGADHV